MRCQSIFYQRESTFLENLNFKEEHTYPYIAVLRKQPLHYQSNESRNVLDET